MSSNRTITIIQPDDLDPLGLEVNPTTNKVSIVGAPETLGQKLRRLALVATTVNPLLSPLASGVTMTTTTTLSTGLTQAYTPEGNAASFAVHGGTATLIGGTTWMFPVSDTSPDTHGNCVPFLANEGLDAWGWEVDFMTDAPLLQIQMQGYEGPQSNFRVIVDGQYVTKAATTFAANGLVSYIQLDFAGVRQARRIQYRCMLQNLFQGVLVSPIDTVWAPDSLDNILAAFTGDSYTNHQGYIPTGGTLPDGIWPHFVAHYLGWRDVRQVAVGGTGYINNGAYTLSGTTYVRVPVIDQIPRWSGLNPDVVVIAAGYNDPLSGLTAAALAAFQAVRAALPNAFVFVLGPWPGSGGQSGSTGTTTLQKEAAILSAFTTWGDAKSFFIPQNNIVVPWISGTGYQGATNGSGNSDVYIWTDGVHPSDMGYEHIGRRAASAMKQAILSIPY